MGKVFRHRRRQGMTVLVVLALITIALAMSYAIMRSQTTTMQLQTNSDRGNQARMAAMAGLNAAMRNMRLSTWAGVGTTLSANVTATDSYTVTYTAGDTQLTSSSPLYAEYPLRVTVTSVGTSIDPNNTGINTTYRAQAVMKLIPRALTASPSNWSTLTSYTLYQLTSQPLTLAVPCRIEGPVRLTGGVNLSEAYYWGTSKRNRYLSDLTLMVAGINEVQAIESTLITGGSFTISFKGATTPSLAWNASTTTVQTALTNLSTIGAGNVTVADAGTGDYVVTFVGQMAGANQPQMTVNASGLFGLLGLSMSTSTITHGAAAIADYRPLNGPLSLPTIRTDSTNLGLLQNQLSLTLNNVSTSSTSAPTISTLATYRMYRGGPQYTAPTLSGSLSNVTLNPDPATNPLGVFYANSNLSLGNNVTINGTVATGGELAVTGTNVRLLPYSLPAVEGNSSQVRLPTVICQGNFRVASGAGVTVNGVMYVGQKLQVDDGAEATSMNLTGNVIVGQDVKFGLRSEWNAYSSTQWDTFYTLFLSQASSSNGVPYFPQAMAVLGRSYVPQLTIKPESTSATRQWLDFGSPLYIPASGDTGMHWDLVRLTENQ